MRATNPSNPAPPSPLETLITRLPKVELHLHLEGAIHPETLRELARAKRRLENKTEAWIRTRLQQGFRYRNFRHFLCAFKLVTLLLESPADYGLATTRLIEWLAEQKVRYAEINLAAGVILWKRQSMEAIFDAIAAATQGAQSRLGVRVNWIFDAIRNFGTDHTRQVLQWAAKFRDQGVVAIGIGGDERRGPAELFTDVYREARDLGLHTVAHAGEAAGPESVRKAVEMLGAERIGHGLTAARDPEVMALLRGRRVPVEVCLSSNVSTGVLARLEEHPLPRFLEAGLVVTLNSDDPAMFGTSLEQEFRLASDQFRLSPNQLVDLCRNAVSASFLPQEEKQALLKELSAAAAC